MLVTFTGTQQSWSMTERPPNNTGLSKTGKTPGYSVIGTVLSIGRLKVIRKIRK
jgi:hypothetical protein